MTSFADQLNRIIGAGACQSDLDLDAAHKVDFDDGEISVRGRLESTTGWLTIKAVRRQDGEPDMPTVAAKLSFERGVNADMEIPAARIGTDHGNVDRWMRAITVASGICQVADAHYTTTS